MSLIKKIFTLQYNNIGIYEKKVIKSDTFVVNGNKWVLEISPYGNKEDEDKYISVFVRCINPPSVNVNYSLYIKELLHNNTIIYRKIEDKVFTSSNNAWGFTQFIERAKVINKENIVFGIDMEIYDDNIIDFEKYFNDPVLSDVRFIVEEKEIYASKIILCNKSSYFESMFKSSGMKETNCDKINPVYLNELRFTPVFTVFKYIYNNELSMSNDDIEEYMQVYKIADMFDIISLRLKIQKYLIEKISVNNINKLLIFSENNNISILRDTIIKFICNDLKTIIKLDIFKEIIMNTDNENLYNFIKDLFDTLKIDDN